MQQFTGKVCSYQLNVVYDKESITFRYFQQTDPSRLYSAYFHKDHTLSSNLQTSQIILETFHSFRNLFEYIQEFSQDQQRVNISNAGYVTLCFFKTKTKTKNAKTIEFDGSKLVSESQKKQQKLIQSQITEVRAQNTFLRQTLFKLQKQCQSQALEIQMLHKNILINKKNYLSDLKADTQLLYRKDRLYKSGNEIAIKELQSEIIQIKNQMKIMLSKMSYLHAVNESLIDGFDQKEYQSEDDAEVSQKYGIKHWVIIDQNNKFLESNYEVKGHVLRKIGVYGSYQVLGRDPIPNTGKHYFSVFLQKINWSIFSVGIASQNRRNYTTSHESPDCITLFAKNGTVWQQGFCRGGGFEIPDGVQLRVVIDFSIKTIKWYQEGKQISSTVISNNLLEKRLVSYIQLNYPENQVTFNRRPEDWAATKEKAQKERQKKLRR